MDLGSTPRTPLLTSTNASTAVPLPGIAAAETAPVLGTTTPTGCSCAVGDAMGGADAVGTPPPRAAMKHSASPQAPGAQHAQHPAGGGDAKKDATAGKHAQHPAGGGDAKKDATAGKHAKHPESGSHEKRIVERTSPEDPALARQALDAVMESFGDTILPTKMNSNGKPSTHRRIPEQMMAQFAQQNPGMPSPTTLVYDKTGTGKPIGVVFTDEDKPVDIGMGDAHQHEAGKRFMQHIWFVPNSLETAFSDTEGNGQEAATRLAGGGPKHAGPDQKTPAGSPRPGSSTQK